MPLVQGRKRRAQPEQDDSPEASPEPAAQRRRITPESEHEAYGGDDGAATQGDGSLEQLVKKMVRLALACEYQRRPIRRADISEKVLGSAGRQFKHVFNEAQLQLRNVFGMEMMELPSREKVTVQQRRAAQKTTQQSNKTTTTAAWVLVSILPNPFRSATILSPPAIPTAAEESKYVAIYTLLISLISLAGGTLPDAKMDRYLRRLQMEDNAPVEGYEKTEKLMKRLERDGYVFKVKETTGAGDDDVYWCVGPRGKVEVGDEGTRGLVRGVYSSGEIDGEGEEDLERRIGRSLGLGERTVERREVGGRAQEGGKKREGRKRREEEEEEEEDEEEG